jgi:putative nucleotidyltransferase with HDIG domain
LQVIPIGFKFLTALTTTIALAMVVVAAQISPYPSENGDMVLGVLVLAGLAVVAESLAVEFSDRITVTAANLPVLLAMMFLGPAPAMAVGAIAGAWGFWKERSGYIAAFNTANYTAAAFMGACGFIAVYGWGTGEVVLSASLLVSGVVAAAVYEATNLVTASLAATLLYDRPFGGFWRTELPPFVRSLAMLASLGLMTAALYATAGLIAVVLLFIPLFASQYMFKLLVREKEHLAKQKELSDQYLEMNIGLAAAMVVLLDSKDEYTAQHSAAVAMYCRDIATALALPEEEAEALHLAGLLHDLGKVGTPDAVLGKTSRLNDEDWDFLRQHPEKGAEVLSHLANYQDVADIVRFHHERLDGSGYPRGARDREIPELSKILAVADSYHAMTSDRPYRDAMSSFEAMNELGRMAGFTLDRRYVEVLGQILRDKDLAYRDGSSTDFMVEYERGRINLRLRGRALADFSGVAEAREDPAVS